MVSDSQRYCRLLSQDENDQIIQLLGERCQALAMAVAQVFQTAAPDHGLWRKRDAGVLVFVKDNPRRSYFFRLYCLSRRNLVWEHELYSNLLYSAPKPFFHMFEAEDCITAFNFANEQEATTMCLIVKEKLAIKQRKRQERKSRTAGINPVISNNHVSSPHSVSTPSLPNGTSMVQPSYQKTLRVKHKGNKQSEKKRLNKADIGLPQDFRHVSHVGWDPNKGFDVDVDKVDDPHLKQFFLNAGVSESQLQDRETRDFIYAFIDQHGGLDRVKTEVEAPELPPPPVPARSAPTNASIRSAPPPPPSRAQMPPPLPPSQPPVVSGPPPAPPLRTLPQRQDSTRTTASGAPAPPPPPPPPMMTAAPVPPPCPPPAPGPPPPAAPAAPVMPAAPAAPDLRSALMDAIRSGKTLKPVSQEEKSRNGAGAGDTRAELMDQIRQGKELKAVIPTPRPAPSNALPSDSLAGALARALADRSKAIHSDSSASSSGEDEDEDDEWED